jgi:exo-beta-1,3-glucanase (GH17 family)
VPSPRSPDDSPRASRATWVAACWALLALAAAGSWWHDARPVLLPDGAAARLPCVSYAPSQQRAGRARESLTAERIRRDLELLARRTSCVRTYTVAEGHDLVPAVAQELGMQVLLGLWIGRDAAHNERELAHGIAVARRHRETVRAIVVGNEVLLRRELSREQLASLIRRVGAETRLPVTYADVWGRWLDHATLARDVSFVTVHILPYWDDEPVAVDDVIEQVDRLYTELQRRIPGKPVFIGETGWPSAGRPRGPAVPGRVEQARFLREFTALAARRGFDFNVIEAFDQPWKIPHEGTVGGHWGLYDREARPKFAWTGPVVDAPRGRWVAALAVLAGLLGAAVTARVGRNGAPARAGLVAFGCVATLVTLGARQWRHLFDANASFVDWTVTLVVCAAGWLALARTARTLSTPRVGPAPDPIPRLVALLLLAGAAYVDLGLVFAGRHRDFPVWLFAPGVLAFAITSLVDPKSRASALQRRSGSDELVLASWLVVAGVLVPWMERFANLASVGWGSASVVLGLAVLLPWAAQAREHHRAADHPGPGPGEVVQHHADDPDRDGGPAEPPRPPP